MKPVLLFFFIATALIVIACNNSTETKREKSEIASDSITMPATDSFINKTPADSIPKNIQIDSVIHLAFAPDSISVTVKGHLEKKGGPVICYLPVVQGRKLTAVVVPEKAKANIRFSHIYLPDGKSDGPFGQTLKYKITQKGIYKIYIGPNMMAGDPVSTDFRVNLKVE